MTFTRTQQLQEPKISYDSIGDIAIIKIPPHQIVRKKTIAERVMKKNNHIKTVLNQISSVAGTFRLRKVEHVLGEPKTTTIYKEYGCWFKVDVASVFFTPRLSYDRQRIVNLVSCDEIVLNMFAGVGCYSILIAKHRPVKRVFSIDLNPKAVELMKENILMNRVADKVIAIEGDAQDVISTRLKQSCNRVLMPLPELAYEYLEFAIQALEGNKGTIHYYDIVFVKKGEDPVERLIRRIKPKLKKLTYVFRIDNSRIIRMVGPRAYQIVCDIHIAKS